MCVSCTIVSYYNFKARGGYVVCRTPLPGLQKLEKIHLIHRGLPVKHIDQVCKQVASKIMIDVNEIRDIIKDQDQ